MAWQWVQWVQGFGLEEMLDEEFRAHVEYSCQHYDERTGEGIAAHPSVATCCTIKSRTRISQSSSVEPFRVISSGFCGQINKRNGTSRDIYDSRGRSHIGLYRISTMGTPVPQLTLSTSASMRWPESSLVNN